MLYCIYYVDTRRVCRQGRKAIEIIRNDFYVPAAGKLKLREIELNYFASAIGFRYLIFMEESKCERTSYSKKNELFHSGWDMNYLILKSQQPTAT